MNMRTSADRPDTAGTSTPAVGLTAATTTTSIPAVATPTVALLTATLLALTGCTADAERESDSPGPGASASSTAGDGAGRASGSADRSNDGGGQEMPEPAPGASPTSDLPGLRSPEDREPLPRRPWPSADAEKDRLVTGWPALVAPLDGATVVSSSLSPAGRRLQFSLEATSSDTATEVLLAHRVRFAEYGLSDEVVDAVDRAQATTFTRGKSAITLTVRRQDGLTHYSLTGVVHDPKG